MHFICYSVGSSLATSVRVVELYLVRIKINEKMESAVWKKIKKNRTTEK